VELAGAEFPKMIHGEYTLKPDGKSLLPLLHNKEQVIHDTLYWEHEGGRAIRIGDWKLTSLPRQEWQLFFISKDHTEMNDLASKFPQKVAEMNRAWTMWAIKTGIKTNN
jgi:arylsulfatase